MTTGDVSELTTQILTSDVSELANKGPMAEFEYHDVKDNNAVRHVQICPLYAISQMDKLLSQLKYGI